MSSLKGSSGSSRELELFLQIQPGLVQWSVTTKTLVTLLTQSVPILEIVTPPAWRLASGLGWSRRQSPLEVAPPLALVLTPAARDEVV